MATILEVTGLSVDRGTTAILKSVDWRVEKGEHWVILGPNGCGKTSLLKALTGYMSPTGGDITVLGQRYGESDWRDLRLHIGLVTSALQASIPGAEPALETVISGRYAQLDLWLKPTPSDVKNAKKWLLFVAASALASREWAYLSQGERQRVLIARSLMARPRLLILDEPCAGLDPVAREEFLQFLQKLARKKSGPSLVLVTHHVEEIMPAFTHALVLRKGDIFAQGPKRKVVTTRILSGAFGARIKLAVQSGRYRAAVG